MRLLVEARESRPRAGCGAAGLRDCRSSRDSGRRRRARSRCRSRPACRDAGRRCGRRGPCRRSAHHDEGHAGRFARDVRAGLRQRCRRDRRGRASGAACARSPPARRSCDAVVGDRFAPHFLRRDPSCRWRYDRAPAARRPGHPFPPSFCHPCLPFGRAYAGAACRTVAFAHHLPQIAFPAHDCRRLPAAIEPKCSGHLRHSLVQPGFRDSNRAVRR